MCKLFSIVYCVCRKREREKEKSNTGARKIQEKVFIIFLRAKKKAQEKVFLHKLTTRPKNSNAITFLCLRAAFKIINIMYLGLFYL